jgi:hypothetical protein
MRLSEFYEFLKLNAPPDDLEEHYRALWYAKKGDWNSAHEIAQDIPSTFGSAIHAYLHRVEGDLGNARYWYSRAGRGLHPGTLEEELDALIHEACSQ